MFFYIISKMKKEMKIGLFIGGLFLILIGALLFKHGGRRNFSPIKQEKVATYSGFASQIEQAQKEKEEKQRIEEEKKRQEEETRRFIQTYGPCRFIPVLMYHHVGTKTGALYVRPDIFAAQMAYLQQKGYSTVGLDDVVDSLISSKPLPAKPVVITFDDGYRDVYTNAFPVLKEKNMRATTFLITQLIGGGEYLTWDQVREMVGPGTFIVGDHTLSHKAVTALAEAELTDQIVAAKNIIQQETGKPVTVFAYPYGSFDSAAEKVLGDNGFVAAVTTHYGLSCAKLPYEIPRVRIGNAPLSSYGL